MHCMIDTTKNVYERGRAEYAKMEAEDEAR
jgi:hypothetical protein